MLHVRPAGFGNCRHVEAVAGCDELCLAIGEPIELAMPFKVVPKVIDAHPGLFGPDAGRHGNIEKTIRHDGPPQGERKWAGRRSSGLIGIMRLCGVDDRKVDIGFRDHVEQIGENVLRSDGKDLHDLAVTVASVANRLDIGIGNVTTFAYDPGGKLNGGVGSGITYVPAARRILEEVEEGEREATGEFTVPKGELVVTAPLMSGRLHVLPVVADFLATFPGINIRLILADRNVDLTGDHIDMAVRIGKLPDSSMVAKQIGVMRTVACASPTLLAGSGTPQIPMIYYVFHV